MEKLIEKYLGEEKKPRLNDSMKKKINKELHKISTGSANNNTYYSTIPWDMIENTLKMFNIVPLQEDMTKWSGMFVGRDSQADIEIAPESSFNNTFYTPYINAMLRLSWYKMQSGRYEILVYIS